MGNRVDVFTITAPATYGAGGDVDHPMTTRQGVLEQLDVAFPRGCAGQVAIAVIFSGQVVIPEDGSVSITGDDEVLHWDLTGFPTSGVWALRVVNRGYYDHTLQVRMLSDDLGVAIDTPTVPVAVTSTTDVGSVDLTAAPTVDTGGDVIGDVAPLDIEPDAAPVEPDAVDLVAPEVT